MTAETEDKKKKSWAWRLVKFIFFVAFFFFVIFTVIANLGGNGDDYKHALEEFIGGATGYEARIETLNRLEFFPDVVFDFDGLTLHTLRGAADPVARVDHVDIATRFWDVILQNNYFKNLNIKNLSVEAGIFSEKPISVSAVDVANLGRDTALVALGRYGDMSVNLSLLLAPHADGTYRADSERRFSLWLDKTYFKGRLKTLDLSSDLRAEIVLDQFLSEEKDFGDLNIDLISKDNILTITPTGTVMEGAVSGAITVDETDPSQRVLNAALQIKDLNYGAAQDQIDGRGDLDIKLSATAPEDESFEPYLKGHVRFIGGQGVMTTGAFNFWGGGLINALVPDFGQSDSLKLNCAVMDMEVAQGVAEVKALFIDTQRLQIAGKGTYDIPAQKIDMTLKPEAKDVEIGTISSAVSITGDITKPSIKPDLVDFGAKIGTLLLGAANPALLAVMFTDFGLSENHPCSDYVQEEAQ